MAAPGENLRINGDRLWDSVHEMAKIGPGVAGGNNRQTLTDADAEGQPRPARVSVRRRDQQLPGDAAGSGLRVAAVEAERDADGPARVQGRRC